MAKANGYLMFDGNCREAMTFYKSCFGGELTVQTFGDMPQGAAVPGMKPKSIMHSLLKTSGFSLMACDRPDGEAVSRGNGLYLMLECESEEEIKRLFGALAVGSPNDTPLADTFWGSIYGDLTDNFGVSWMLNYDKPKG
jgi:PhnB protein